LPGDGLDHDLPTYGLLLSWNEGLCYHVWLVLLRWGLANFLLGLQTVVLLIPASWVAGITGMSRIVRLGCFNELFSFFYFCLGEKASKNIPIMLRMKPQSSKPKIHLTSDQRPKLIILVWL
jgi:hypothetical protein